MRINGFHYITLFKQNKNVLKLALPIIIELILTVGIGYINQFMFASFPEGTNAIGQVNQISNIFIVSFSVLATSSLILISQLRGANNESGIRKIYPLTLFINCLLGILVAIVLMAIAPFIFDWMQVDVNIIPYAKLYLYVTAPSLIFYSLNQAFSNFLRANKRMIEPTIISVFMSVINIIIVAVMTVLMFLYFRFSKHGYELSVVGESENTAKYVGINVKKVIIRTMVLSGVLCGLAGLLLVGGTSFTLASDTVDGRGFTAILVAWLGKFSPPAMAFTSLLYVFIDQGAKNVATGVGIGDAFSEIITGIFFFLVIGCEFFINYKIKFRPRKKKEENSIEEVAA